MEIGRMERLFYQNNDIKNFNAPFGLILIIKIILKQIILIHLEYSEYGELSSVQVPFQKKLFFAGKDMSL